MRKRSEKTARVLYSLLLLFLNLISSVLYVLIAPSCCFWPVSEVFSTSMAVTPPILVWHFADVMTSNRPNSRPILAVSSYSPFIIAILAFLLFVWIGVATIYYGDGGEILMSPVAIIGGYASIFAVVFFAMAKLAVCVVGKLKSSQLLSRKRYLGK